MESRGKISTGSYDFNKWLFGGYEKDVITMIAGPPGSGKTNFCVLVSCSQAKKGNKVIFIDTEGGFSVERVRQVVGEEYQEALKNIFLLEPTSFEEQEKNLYGLLNRVKKNNVGLIVIDGMATLYRLELGEVLSLNDGEQVKKINRRVAQQMRILSDISRKQNIPIVITNQVYSDFTPRGEEKVERGVNLVGGDLFKYWSKCIIELKNDNRRRRAILLKHRSLPEKELSFDIKDKGIFRKGWI